MEIKRVAVKLLTDWAGRRAGHEFPLMDSRTAELLVQQKRAEYLEEKKDVKPTPKKKRKRKPADSGTTDASGSESAPVDQHE